jgi:hypothetical protein
MMAAKWGKRGGMGAEKKVRKIFWTWGYLFSAGE